MAQHEEIVLWLDRRWKNAIEKHLKGETLQEHLETVLDALCNQLPQREYERISREIYAEDVASCEAEESARTYAAYHVVENGQEWYYKTNDEAGEDACDGMLDTLEDMGYDVERLRPEGKDWNDDLRAKHDKAKTPTA